MATPTEHARWKAAILKEHPFMSALPEAVDAMIEMYTENRKDFNKLVEEIKAESRQRSTQTDDATQVAPPAEKVICCIRKGEAETNDDDTGLDRAIVSNQPVEQTETQSGNDAGM